MDRWIDDDSDERQKPFDFNRFTELLTRGAWPFLYQLIIGMALGMLIGVVYVMFIVAVMATKEPAIAVIGFFLYMLSIFLIHGQVTGKFDFGAAWAFAKDFYAKIGLTNLLGIAFACIVIDTVCVLAGLFLLCVGVYPAAAAVILADNHVMWQLYNKYLDKGGRTLPRFERPRKDESPRDDGPIDRV
jgi:hypothetical protein